MLMYNESTNDYQQVISTVVKLSCELSYNPSKHNRPNERTTTYQYQLDRASGYVYSQVQLSCIRQVKRITVSLFHSSKKFLLYTMSYDTTD